MPVNPTMMPLVQEPNMPLGQDATAQTPNVDVEALVKGISGLLGAETETKNDHMKSGEERRNEEKQYEESVQYNFDKGAKARVAAYVKKLVDDAKAARSSWERNLYECMDLYEGIRAPKSDPWPNCSNVTTMAIPTHTKLMHAKLFPAVWNENLVYWRPVSGDDIENVDNIKKFMQWVVRQEMKLGNLVDDILQDLIVTGTVALKVRWDTEYRNMRDKDNPGKYKEIARQRAYVDNVPIDEVYMPYLWSDVNTSEFIAQDIYMRFPDLENKKARGLFTYDKEDEDAILGAINQNLPESIRIEKGKTEGTAEYYAHRDSYPIRLVECNVAWPIDGKMVESIFVIDYNSSTYLSGKPLTAVSPTGTRPWIVGQFIRRTGRPYGVGLPDLMKGLAKELDAIHNQRIDAGTMSIAPFGVYRAASSFDPEKVKVGPGIMVPVDDINDVNFIQVPNNSIASFQEERIIIEYMEKLTATSAYQMGRESEVAKSRATATGTMAIIAQGEQAYTLLGIRAQIIFAEMLTKILQAYQAFMPSGLADRVVGEDAGKLLFPDGMTIEELAGEYDAYMNLDVTAGSKAMEKQSNAAMIQMAPQLLAISQDPRGYRMAEDFIKSLGKVDPERYLGPMPKQGPATAGGMGAFGQQPVGPGMGLPGAGGAPNV